MCTVNKIRDFFNFLQGKLYFFFIFTKYNQIGVYCEISFLKMLINLFKMTK